MFLDECFQIVFGGHFSDARLCKLITCFSFQQLQSRFKSFPSGSPKFLNKTFICFPCIKLKWLGFFFFFFLQINQGCCAVLRSPQLGHVHGVSTHRLIKPSAPVSLSLYTLWVCIHFCICYWNECTLYYG